MKYLKYAGKWQFKLIISILLLFFIFSRFPLSEIADCLKRMHLGWFLAAVALGELMLLSQAFRWSYLIILPRETKPKIMNFIRYTAIGYFFNMLAPGGLGGDAYRSVAFGRAEKMMSHSIASVFFARILGMLAITVLFWLGYMLLPGDDLEKIPFYAIWFMIISTVVFLLACFFFLFNPINKIFASSKNSYLQKIASVINKISDYKKHPVLLFLAFADSVFIQFLAVVSQWVCFAAIGVDVSWSLLLIIVPITLLAIAVPVSFNGMGVREFSLLFLSVNIINPNELLASVLLGYAVTLFLALQGGVAYLLKK